MQLRPFPNDFSLEQEDCETRVLRASEGFWKAGAAGGVLKHPPCREPTVIYIKPDTGRLLSLWVDPEA